MGSNDLSALEPWIAGYLARLQPAERLKVSRKIGAMLRQRNARRVRDNVNPDGSAMEPRRVQRDRRGRIRQRKGKMFKKIELARNTKITARADSVELAFRPRVADTAAEHHFGLTAPVDRRIRGSIRVRYAARRLFGIPANDREAIMDAVLSSIS